MLCPSCDAVFSAINSENRESCPSCGYTPCSFAIHINEGTRKMWMDVESGPRWKRNKKIHRSLSHELRDDPDLTRDMNEMVDTMFETFRNLNSDELFPRYREDYARTTGKRSLLHVRKERSTFSTRRERKSKSEEQRGLSTVKKTSCVKKTGLLQNAGLSGALCMRAPSRSF